MLKHWLLAARPKTLVASILPVCCGFLLAREQSPLVSPYVGLLCLFYCFAVQVGTNFANDFFDYKKGADANRSHGPERMVSSGLIKPEHMLLFAFLVLLLGFLIGVTIMEMVSANRSLIIVGISSFLFAIIYTGGPFPLAYNGLGDVFVIVFFGFVAVHSTHYVLCLSAAVEWEPNWILPLGIGFVINNLLVVNNYRDFEEDRDVGKRTSVVIFGKTFGLFLFVIGVGVSTILIPFLVPSAFPTIFLCPLGLYTFFLLRKALVKSDYGKVLSLSAITVLLYTTLLLLGYLYI